VNDAPPLVERLVFFTDAVFAIAITLLVIDLRIPDLAASGSGLWAALSDQAGYVFAFVVGFVVIGSYWIGHLRIFRVVAHANGVATWLNLGFLFWIVATPFATGVLGANPLTFDTVVFFAAVQAAAGFCQLMLWLYLTRHVELLRAVPPRPVVTGVAVQLARAPSVFLFSILVAIAAGPILATWTWPLIAVAGILLSRVFPLGPEQWGPNAAVGDEAASPLSAG
jgi:TMEM175 potassium channel family protein